MKISVLGTDYDLVELERGDDTRIEESDGICDDSVKEITPAKIERDKDSKTDLGRVRQKILRHEIVLAFLCESGLAENSDWAQDEEMVDWIAIQGPKIYRAGQEAGAV